MTKRPMLAPRDQEQIEALSTIELIGPHLRIDRAAMA